MTCVCKVFGCNVGLHSLRLLFFPGKCWNWSRVKQIWVSRTEIETTNAFRYSGKYSIQNGYFT